MGKITCPRCKGDGQITLEPGFGPAIKYARESKDQSLSQAATVIGCTKAHLHALEQGTSANPSARVVLKIAKHFGMSLDELVATLENADD